jgi:hypothetical protein
MEAGVMRASWLTVMVAAGLASAVVLTGLGTGSAATDLPGRSVSGGSAPGSELWSSVQAGTGDDIAVDPGGSAVFVVGSSFLVAYDSAAGTPAWEKSKAGGKSVAVSPDGKTVFVIKAVHGSQRADFSTSAYSASTGTLLWSRGYHGRVRGVEEPAALVVSPGGGTVFVTGTSQGRTSGADFATVAYAAASGKQLWVARYNSAGRDSDGPVAMAVSPGGAAVYVTGLSVAAGGASKRSFSTVAYGTASGRSLWTRRYSLPSRNPLRVGNFVSAVAVSRNGQRVFVAGSSTRKGSGAGFAAVAYAAASGRQLWVRRYEAAKDNDYAEDMLVSPGGGGTVIVAGDGEGIRAGHGSQYLAVAYSATTGRTRWVSRIVDDHFPVERVGKAALSPDGRSFYMAGTANFVDSVGGDEPADSLTVAATVATGRQSWSQTVSTDNFGQAGGLVAVSPDGGAVYIGVEDASGTSADDFMTVALRS